MTIRAFADNPPWTEVPKILQILVEADLHTEGDVAPCLAAYADDRLRFFGFVRPFERGAYHQPLDELFAFATRLGSNRLALAMGARIWSLDDPIPPVTEGVDLRQRVVMVHRVDAQAPGAPTMSSEAWPFDLNGKDLTWHERFAPEDTPVGWVIEAMERAANAGATGQGAGPASDVGDDLFHLGLLGHSFMFGPSTATALRVSDSLAWLAN